MPFPETPSPFRVSRRYAPSRRVNPQFANSPRFLLSQTAENNDLDIVDDDELPSTAPKPFTPARTPQTKHIPRRQRDVVEDSGDELHGDDTHSPHPRDTIFPQNRRDTIEDSDEELLPRDGIAQGTHTAELADDAIHSTPPDNLFTPKPVVIEEDAPFKSIQDGTKRQRLSTGDSQPLAQRQHTAEPRVYKRPTMPIQSTPGPSSATPFRTKPRFMFSSRQPSSAQPVFRTETAPHTTPQPERRKLTFVLPRSPSPSAADDIIPAPFSPSSRTLRRRGRNRSGAPVYTPGGMAAEVRSWILEMGSKHEPMATSRVFKPRDDPSRYHMSACVISVRQDVRASGPVSFIRAEAESAEKTVFNLMAMGQSALGTGQIQPGSLVGIRPGLMWTVDLDSSEPPGNGRPGQSWLVAMELDLLDRETA